MTQDLNSEIERIVKEFETTFVFSLKGVNKLLGKEKSKFLRKALRSIAEKTVEAVRVEERRFTDFDEVVEEDYIIGGYNDAVDEQNKLSSAWLGKEN